MNIDKLKLNTDQRPFIMVYHDFLESEILDNPYQITLYICLKKFADKNNQCFPSLKKLAKVSRMSQRKVQETLKELEEKHIISIENRVRIDGGKGSNIYTIHDFRELWIAENTEQIKLTVDIEELRLFELAKKKGYILTKEKELDSEPTKAQNQAIQSKNLSQSDNTTDLQESQDLEKYTLEQIQQIFSYDAMVHDYPYEQEHIDSVMNILHTAMNTTKATIRIAGTDKPTMVVIGKLMKLNNESILYAIRKYKEQTERIKNPTSYMLTILYMAPEQFHLDITNQVQHDMENW